MTASCSASPDSGLPVAVAVTGASGSAYAVRLLQVLLQHNVETHLVTSDAARQVMMQELGCPFPDDSATQEQWKTQLTECWSKGPARTWGFPDVKAEELTGTLKIHNRGDYTAGIASGSFRSRAMVICPCSTGTLSAIATGASRNLVHRAADVHLKERRPLILVPRETPFSSITLQNMQTVTAAGAVVLPAMPGFYHQPAGVAELVDFIVARICDQLQLDVCLAPRWGQK